MLHFILLAAFAVSHGVCETIWQDYSFTRPTTWTEDGSPYLLHQSISLSESRRGTSLTIADNVEVCRYLQVLVHHPNIIHDRLSSWLPAFN